MKICILAPNVMFKHTMNIGIVPDAEQKWKYKSGMNLFVKNDLIHSLKLRKNHVKRYDNAIKCA